MKVFVHIGYYKTGTTALQKFLEDNRVVLRKHGICYPTAGKPVNNWGLAILANGLLESVSVHVPAWYQRGKHRRPQLYDVHAQWAEAVRELEESMCGVGVISCEAFIRFGDAPQGRKLVEFVQRKLANFDVHLVCYIRRPDRYLVSWYNQLISAGDRIPRLRFNLEHYINTIHVDYMRALRPWAEVFGADCILVRDYDAIRTMNSDTIEDFSKLCEITFPEEVHVDQPSVNRSLPYTLVELKRLHNHFANGLNDLRRANRALRFVQDNIELPPDEEVEILSISNRERLIDAFIPCQQELTRLWGNGRRFFPDLEEPISPDSSLITDGEAAVRYAGLFSFALSQFAASDMDHQNAQVSELRESR